MQITLSLVELIISMFTFTDASTRKTFARTFAESAGESNATVIAATSDMNDTP